MWVFFSSLYLIASSSLVVRRVVGSIPRGGPIELFLVQSQCSAIGVYVLSCLWDGACNKSTLAANRKE